LVYNVNSSAFNQAVQGLGHKLTNINHDPKIGYKSPCNTSKIPFRNATTGHNFNNLFEDPRNLLRWCKHTVVFEIPKNTQPTNDLKGNHLSLLATKPDLKRSDLTGKESPWHLGKFVATEIPSSR